MGNADEPAVTVLLGPGGARSAPTAGTAVRHALAAHDPGDRVLTVGSLSNIAWGGIRIGWLRAPARLVALLCGEEGPD